MSQSKEQEYNLINKIELLNEFIRCGDVIAVNQASHQVLQDYQENSTDIVRLLLNKVTPDADNMEEVTSKSPKLDDDLYAENTPSDDEDSVDGVHTKEADNKQPEPSESINRLSGVGNHDSSEDMDNEMCVPNENMLSTNKIQPPCSKSPIQEISTRDCHIQLGPNIKMFPACKDMIEAPPIEKAKFAIESISQFEDKAVLIEKIKQLTEEKRKMEANLKQQEESDSKIISELTTEKQKLKEQFKEDMNQQKEEYNKLKLDREDMEGKFRCTEDKVKQLTEEIKKKEQECIKKDEEVNQVKNTNNILFQKLTDGENQFQQEREQRYKEICSLKSSLEQKCNENKALHGDLEQLTANFREMKRERDDLTQRLSEEWSKKVAADERNIENISIRNRPINIADDYQALCSNEWLDVKEAVDNELGDADEEKKKQLLCEIMIMCEEKADKLHIDIMRNIQQYLTAPINSMYAEIPVKQRSVYAWINMIDDKVESQNHNEIQDNTPNGLSKTLVAPVIRENDQSSGTFIDEGSNVDFSPSNDQNPQSRQEEDMDHDAKENTGKMTDYEGADPDKNIDVQTSSETENNQQTVTENHATGNILDIEIARNEIEWYFVAEEGPIHKKDYKDGSSMKIPEQVTNCIGDYLRGLADNVDISRLAKDTIDNLSDREDIMPLVVILKDNAIFNQYVEACGKLAWKMVIQRPKMKFAMEGIGKKWDERYQEPAFDGDDPNDPSSEVKYYIHPTLMHADAIMVKGRVLTKKNNMNSY